MVLDHEREHPSRWATIVSISAKIGCTGQTLNEWLKKAERDSGRAPGVTTEMAARLKALEQENRELRQANEILRKASAYFALAPLGERKRSPRPSTASTRPKSSIGAGRGGRSRPLNSRPSNGWTGSTIVGCSNPSATSRRQKLNADTTLCSNSKTWQRDSTQIASEEPGAVQSRLVRREISRIDR